jgi:5,10-methylenetetrahydromethanopterin reductase
MTDSSSMPVGVLLAGVPPKAVGNVAQAAEHAGFCGLWAPEDYPEHPASVVAALAVASTSRIEIGTGVMSLTTRHPLLGAMELATLAEAAPGRFVAGMGLGLPLTLESIGCLPQRPLSTVRHRFDVVARLLKGDTVTFDDGGVSLNASSLAHAPEVMPALALGGLGPRMLDLAGEIADVVIVSSLGTEAYLRWAIERVGAVASVHRRPRPRVIAFAWYHLSESDERGRDALRANVAGALGALGPGPLTDADGWSAQLASLRQSAGPLLEHIPATWIDEMVIAGTAAQCARGIERRLRAGADEVVLCPMGADAVAQLERTAREVLPLVSVPPSAV